MSITSETQRKYDPNKGGFSYYTLFHADKGERPSWAQDGDMLEEFGEGGKAYVCSRDAKGRINWTEKADWDRQTGGGSSEGGGGGLPADFPAEGIANANKFIGFDGNGKYDALDAPSGGDSHTFGFTVTAQSPTEYTATPDSGVTFVAVKEAMTQTPNVYFKCILPDGANATTLVTTERTSNVSAAFVGLTAGGIPQVLRLLYSDDGSTDVKVITLQPYSS